VFIDLEISRWTRVRAKFETEGRKEKIHPFIHFRRIVYWKRVGYWPTAGRRARQRLEEERDRRTLVHLYVCRHEGTRGSCRSRRVSASRETVVNSVDGDAGGDKAPQCGAVDTTTTTTTTTTITTTTTFTTTTTTTYYHYPIPLPTPLFDDLSFHPDYWFSLFLSLPPLKSLFFTFVIIVFI